MAKCFVSGGGGLEVKTGIITSVNGYASAVLGGIPQMVAITIPGYTLSTVIVCKKQPNISARIIAVNGGSLGSLSSTNNGFQVSFEYSGANELIHYFAIM